MLTISLVHEVPYAVADWQNPLVYVRLLGLWALCSGFAFVLISWQRRQLLIETWRAAQAQHDWRTPLLANLVLFAATLAVMLVLRRLAAAGSVPPAYWLGIHTSLIAVIVASLLRLDVPVRTLLSIASRHRVSIAAAVVAGLFVQLMSILAQDGWRTLAGATLEVSRSILELYETDVVADAAERTLRVGNFKAIIGETCSGYEGIGLVAAFLSIYLWVFRGSLRFPHALLLFPIGIGAVWFLNAVRIAALVSLGAHVSPQIAVHGFHSQAGWIAFLMVTLATMVLAHRSKLIARASSPPPTARHAETQVAAYLVPFVALMMSSMVMAAVAPSGQPLYALKVAAVGFVLWHFRDVYRALAWRVSGEALISGLAVGAVWIATDPDPSSGVALGTWLAQQGASVAVIWLILRAIGSAVLVPLAEELAFRGFLYRWCISRNFEAVPLAQVSLFALVASSLLFGMLHERWLAASLSGVVFALVMLRTGRLGDAIIAHGVANALICAWAIGFAQWSLL
jgi:exosortase E/protease (VPEID-CTERM system)